MFNDRYKNILVFGMYVLFHPQLLLVSLKCHLPTYIQLQWLHKWNIKTFIDVGAHEGQEIRAILSLFPKAQIYAFEPQTTLYNKIKHLSSSAVNIINSAVGEKNSKAKLGIPSYTPAASILKPTQELSDEFGHFSLQSIDVTSLDSFFETTQLSSPVALKIDTQGYEMNVLKGAKKTLAQVDVVYVETPLSKMYIGSPVFDDIYNFLIKSGFTYSGSIPDSQFWPQFNLQLVQNSVFVRKTPKN